MGDCPSGGFETTAIRVPPEAFIGDYEAKMKFKMKKDPGTNWEFEAKWDGDHS